MPTDIQTFRREYNDGLSSAICESAEPDNRGVANWHQLAQDGIQRRPDKEKGKNCVSLIARRKAVSQ